MSVSHNRSGPSTLNCRLTRSSLGPTGRVTHRAATASPPVEALDAHGAHQPGDPLAVHRPSEPEAQLSMHPSPAVDALGLGVNLFNLL